MDFGAMDDENSEFPNAIWKVLEGISHCTKDPLFKVDIESSSNFIISYYVTFAY